MSADIDIAGDEQADELIRGRASTLSRLLASGLESKGNQNFCSKITISGNLICIKLSKNNVSLVNDLLTGHWNHIKC